MYNFTVPTALKTWIDYVYRYGHTVESTPNGPRGTLAGRKLVGIITSGGAYSAGPAAARNHVEPYLRTVFGVFGLTDMRFVYAEGLSRGEATAAAGIAKARAALPELAA